MNKCAGKDCQNEGTEYRDYTVTGIGDFRYFCKDCVHVADIKRSISMAESDIRYAESVLKYAVANVVKAKHELKQEKSKLDALIKEHGYIK